MIKHKRHRFLPFVNSVVRWGLSCAMAGVRWIKQTVDSFEASTKN